MEDGNQSTMEIMYIFRPKQLQGASWTQKCKGGYIVFLGTSVQRMARWRQHNERQLIINLTLQT